jgi:phage FluMu protein Com
MSGTSSHIGYTPVEDDLSSRKGMRVECASCGKTGRVSKKLDLQHIKCPVCKTMGSLKVPTPPTDVVEAVDCNQTLRECPYCGEDIKLNAIKCKHCKEMLLKDAPTLSDIKKPEFPSMNFKLSGCLEVLVIFVSVMLTLLGVVIFKIRGVMDVKSLSLQHSDSVESNFSPWDGSHKKLVAYIKAKMNDPYSFEHVETKYIKDNGMVKVFMKFRGKNVYGVLVLKQAVAITTLDGYIISVTID